MRSPTAVVAVAALLLLLVTLAAAVDTTVPPKWDTIEEARRQVMAEWKAKHGKNFKERSEEEARRVFADWKARHGKVYSSAREEKRRYSIFKESLRIADQNKAAFGPNYFIGIDGPFSDLTQEEFISRCCGYVPEPRGHRVSKSANKSYKTQAERPSLWTNPRD